MKDLKIGEVKIYKPKLIVADKISPTFKGPGIELKSDVPEILETNKEDNGEEKC